MSEIPDKRVPHIRARELEARVSMWWIYAGILAVIALAGLAL